jgi:DNA polymerase delta subunit 4
MEVIAEIERRQAAADNVREASSHMRIRERKVLEQTKPAFSARRLAQVEKELCNWDTTPRYGNCVSISRFDRWHRANRLGLAPPHHILEYLTHQGVSNVGMFDHRLNPIIPLLKE